MKECTNCIYYNMQKRKCIYDKKELCREYISIFSCCQNRCEECRHKYICDKKELQVKQIQTRYKKVYAI